MQQNWRDVFIKSEDGLRLFSRDYGPENADNPAVLCLAGLTRNSRDFHKVATRLSRTHRVIVPDYRGRGLSEYAKDWETYQPQNEMADAIELVDELGIEKFVVLGTSRGGLISMIMGQTIRHRLLGVILNDIGPKLEDEGLLRIAESINDRSEIESWSSLVKDLKNYSAGFSGLSEDDWLEFAHNLYRERNGKIEPDYDFNLTRTFPTVEFIKAGKIPQAWELFETFKGLPVAVIRGENSDLLSSETVEKMQAVHPGLIVATVPDRAHVPFLDEPEAVEAIDAVLKAL